MTAAEAVAVSRAAQGLSERITDPTALQRVAALLAATTAGNGGRDV